MAGATFEKRKLLNYSEYKVFKIILDEITLYQQDYQVFPQTNFGEFLHSPNDDARRSINSKRADMLIVDRAGWPVAVVEYQGTGHYQGNWGARDAVKREALRRAGVGYIAILADDNPTQIRLRVREQLGGKQETSNFEDKGRERSKLSVPAMSHKSSR